MGGILADSDFDWNFTQCLILSFTNERSVYGLNKSTQLKIAAALGESSIRIKIQNSNHKKAICKRCCDYLGSLIDKGYKKGRTTIRKSEPLVTNVTGFYIKII